MRLCCAVPGQCYHGSLYVKYIRCNPRDSCLGMPGSIVYWSTQQKSSMLESGSLLALVHNITCFTAFVCSKLPGDLGRCAQAQCTEKLFVEIGVFASIGPPEMKSLARHLCTAVRVSDQNRQASL